MASLLTDGVRRKLAILADAAKYDASCASSGSVRKGQRDGIGANNGQGICHSYTPDGRCVSLLKILLTNTCVYDCLFCVNRVSNDVPRARITPAEVATLTIEFYKRNFIEGLFLSSGVVVGADHTAEQMIEVGRLLREEQRFNGYIHFKVVPGTSPELIARLGHYADRLSANIELPTQPDLDLFAPQKSLVSVNESMATIAEGITARAETKLRHAPAFAPAGQSTQLVVGATPTSDAVILHTASSLYKTHRLRRVYYTAFSPFQHADPRLPPQAPPLVREHRLYQADWLVRHYGFAHHELTTHDRPNLDLDVDPKQAWALRHREVFPVDVNRADREMLLRVPGMGVRAADRVLAVRRSHAVTLRDLARLRVALGRARPFIITADHNPALAWLDGELLAQRLRPPKQLSLFDAAAGARTGQL